MSADKEKMRNSANYYAGLVTAAKNSCEDAYVKLVSTIGDIEDDWSSDAGTQLTQCLESTRQSIRTLYERLRALESQMKTQAAEIYDTWPESEEEV